MLLGPPGLTTRSKKIIVAKGITTSNKKLQKKKKKKSTAKWSKARNRCILDLRPFLAGSVATTDFAVQAVPFFPLLIYLVTGASLVVTGALLVVTKSLLI